MGTGHRLDRIIKKITDTTFPGASGSLTVEASMVVPFFFLCMAALITLLNVYGSYARKLTELQEQAETAAVAIAAASGADPIVELRNFVDVAPAFAPFPLTKLRVPVCGRVRAWVGADAAQYEGAAETAADDELVYVTEHESVYHTNSACTHLKLRIEAVSLAGVGFRRNADRRRYHACEKCIGSGKAAGVVYISPEGDAYHNKAACSGLTRHVHMEHKGDVSGLHQCARCAAEAA